MSGDREKLVASATVVLASWAICGLSYASVPPGESGVISLFVFVAGSLTLTAPKASAPSPSRSPAVRTATGNPE